MMLQTIALTDLHAHPRNSNVMSNDAFAKLVAHLRDNEQYPPIIVRKIEQGYQLLDGHHRSKALRKLNRTHARCVVWQANDEQALLLLATLNRLQGQDDPRKRGELLSELRESIHLDELAKQLPDSLEKIHRLIDLRELATPKPSAIADDLPVPVHFFLSREQKQQLETKLKTIGGPRETALMSLVH